MPTFHLENDRLFFEIEEGNPAVGRDCEAIVFLHSLGTDHRLWKYQFSALKDQAPLLIAPDCRGHGQSTWSGNITLQKWVEDIYSIIDSLNISKVVLCGVSMGGVQAMAFAEAHPERVSRLILADTFAQIDVNLIDEKVRLTGGVAMEQGMEKFAETYLDATLSMSASSMQIRKDLHQAISDMDVAAYHASAKACFSADVLEGLSDLRIPTLVLIGDDDQKTPMPMSKKIVKALPGAKLSVVPAARHLANVDNPDTFNQLIIDFLKSQ